jgi:hypothetical protein
LILAAEPEKKEVITRPAVECRKQQEYSELAHQKSRVIRLRDVIKYINIKEVGIFYSYKVYR